LLENTIGVARTAAIMIGMGPVYLMKEEEDAKADGT
jgi:hypothetical protein